MRITRFVQAARLALALGLAGSGGGCGPGAQAPMDPQKQDQIRESRKAAHRQIQESNRARAGAGLQGADRKALRRGRPGG